MSYIEFDKSQLTNLSYAMNRELLGTNRRGSYGSTTLAGCNTRKYHGLLVAPQPQIDGDLHVLLSSLDESIVGHDEEFQLAIHQYKDKFYYPKGQKYLRNLEYDPQPSMIYRVGAALFKKERINAISGVRFMVKYTLLEANSDVTLKVRPLLAFRNRHNLMKANDNVSSNYEEINGGIKYRMYDNYSFLNFQINKQFNYTHEPNWYYGFEYEKDKERGYDYIEDLFSPGFFKMPIKVGESIILSIATDECNPAILSRLYSNELKKRTPRNDFKNCLINDALQCLIEDEGKQRVLAGYQWLGVIPRDTFIALPGLTLPYNNVKEFKNVINSMIEDMDGPFFKYYHNVHSSKKPSADASLWFCWCLQQYVDNTRGTKAFVWKNWGHAIKKILHSYYEGAGNGIYANENGLLHQGEPDLALTWMNAFVDEKPVTPRTGYAVEINALWYNAICFALELAKYAGDFEFVDFWGPVSFKIKKAFNQHFYNISEPCLCDYFNDETSDWRIRPNQLIAIAMKFSPLSDDVKLNVLRLVKSELFTPHGIRTLSPRYPEYISKSEGNHNNRGLALHNGSAYPWLLIFYIEAIKHLENENYIHTMKKIVGYFEPEMMEGCIGSISQTYNGNPPYEGSGTVSHATNIAALLWITKCIEDFEHNTD
ncbi:glycogen debranching enzyme N-terminal domain-containing protein [Bacteroidales bacterium OttesenSCG-928-K03]|nr:glycogen debranching enzyme N-terminal domain-containing protein [Odoribacter sp. OttesenSCG-928-L07]MDL2239586.1 glycogen debranching enzyme N-terminal domain-containing protein [Bacteroidales bacterium OttesenSCG-928-L14]MDL2242546.1 glycogen debranching enzyme N-terminal domain-containing protein [Bacteroidales bacterium OttesenSCG-928-K03]